MHRRWATPAVARLLRVVYRPQPLPEPCGKLVRGQVTVIRSFRNADKVPRYFKGGSVDDEAIDLEERFHRHERRAFVPVQERLILGDAYTKHDRLFSEVCSLVMSKVLGTQQSGLQESKGTKRSW